MDTDASAAPTTPVLDPKRLTVDQLRGLDCGYCRGRLYRARLIDVVRVGEGAHESDVQLYACEPVCRPRVLLVPHAWCRYCHDPIEKAGATVIGFTEVASGPGRPIYADAKCVVAYRVMPLTEHPQGTDGQPRYRERRFVTSRP
ncbi:hypothetical protein [Streptomyces sp. PH10-H1]|uniref:hypothetical protein n=1 Tax=Streptomyces sp. PH10-H1 TaxID=3046212 RepID=UPI0024BB3A39|nr:hypothetical protein [Streptomyces sp. PH10-H1]MDJ0346737.1 hypothetical protein [Streptomyces sp. PH10-H1]